MLGDPASQGPLQDPVQVSLTVDALPATSRTSLNLSLTQFVPKTRSNVAQVLRVYLCGPVGRHPNYISNRGTSITFTDVLESPSTFLSYVGPLSSCSYTDVKISDTGGTSTEGSLHQALLLGDSATPAGAVRGSRVQYVLPGIVTVPFGMPIGGTVVSRLPKGSEATIGLRNIPADFVTVISSPQLPDTGRLQWLSRLTEERAVSEYRLSGSLIDKETEEQRRILLAGAFLGIAGGGLIWLLDVALSANGGTRGRAREHARVEGVPGRAGYRKPARTQAPGRLRIPSRRSPTAPRASRGGYGVPPRST